MTNTALDPFLTACSKCSWSIAVWSAEEKERREKAHAERAHMATVEAVTGLVTTDPSHTAEVEAVERAIVYDGRTHGGEVDPNRVRALLPPWITPQVIGATYRTMHDSGRLRVVASTTNRDRKGRNVGKPLNVYRLTGEEHQLLTGGTT